MTKDFYVYCFEMPDGSCILGKVDRMLISPEKVLNAAVRETELQLTDPMLIFTTMNPQTGQLIPSTTRYGNYRDADFVVFNVRAAASHYMASKTMALKYEEIVTQWKAKESGIITDPNELRKFR